MKITSLNWPASEIIHENLFIRNEIGISRCIGPKPSIILDDYTKKLHAKIQKTL